MNLSEFRQAMKNCTSMVPGDELCSYMHERADATRTLCQQLNGGVHTPEEIRALIAEIIQEPVDESLITLTPLIVDGGLNLHFGKNVFINAGCSFQDQGGIWIGDNALIGHNAVFATLNHDEDPRRRGILHPKPIVVEKDVWIGSNCTILGGVTIGEGAIVAAGSVVTRDVPTFTIVAGVPARVVREVRQSE